MLFVFPGRTEEYGQVGTSDDVVVRAHVVVELMMAARQKEKKSTTATTTPEDVQIGQDTNWVGLLDCLTFDGF